MGDTPALLLKTRLKCCTVWKPVRVEISETSSSVVSSSRLARLETAAMEKFAEGHLGLPQNPRRYSLEADAESVGDVFA